MKALAELPLFVLLLVWRNMKAAQQVQEGQLVAIDAAELLELRSELEGLQKYLDGKRWLDRQALKVIERRMRGVDVLLSLGKQFVIGVMKA